MTKDIQANQCFAAIAEKLASSAADKIAFDAIQNFDLTQWEKQHPPENWFVGNFSLEGELTSVAYFAIETNPLFAVSALIQKTAKPQVQERLANLELNDQDKEGMRETINQVSEALAQSLQKISGKQIQCKVNEFGAATQIAPMAGEGITAMQAACNVAEGLASGSAVLLVNADLAALLQQASADSSSAEEAEDDSTKPWWKRRAAKADTVIALGSSEVMDRAAEICKILKLEFQHYDHLAAAKEVLQNKPDAAVLAYLNSYNDPLFGELFRMRRSPEMLGRRVLLCVARNARQWKNQVYVLPPTGVWNYPHEPKQLAGLLTQRVTCA